MSPPAADAAIGASTLIDGLAGIIGLAAAGTDRFGIAVSGGPDSMALLALAHAAMPGRVAAATVDHQLRADSADEARMVAAHCAGVGIAHSILTPAQPISGSLQSAARAARYAALGRWRQAAGLDWIITAHHADDQLETMLMRLNRGSGVRGLSAIRNRQGHVLRPLLATPRASLLDYLRRMGWPSVDDPSNSDPRFDRARMRAMLAQTGGLDAVSASTSARALADAEDALDWSVAHIAAERMTFETDAIHIDLTDLPPFYARRMVENALVRLEPERPPPRADALTRTLTALAQGDKAMLGNCLLRADRTRPGTIIIKQAPARRSG